jgi:hypothetical protein
LASLASCEGSDLITKLLDVVTLVGEALSAVGNIINEMESACGYIAGPADITASDTDQPVGANDDEAGDDARRFETLAKGIIRENVTDEAWRL